MVDINRAQRIADQIRKELSQLFIHEVNDPRIKMVSITDVEISRDLSHAKIFYTLIDTKLTQAEAEKALKKAAGFMRSRIAAKLELRITPKLRFIFDTAMEHGRHISHLINSALVKDASRSQRDEEE